MFGLLRALSTTWTCNIQVNSLAHEVINQLRDVVGTDELLAATSVARSSIAAQRTQRRTHQKLQVRHRIGSSSRPLMHCFQRKHGRA